MSNTKMYVCTFPGPVGQLYRRDSIHFVLCTSFPATVHCGPTARRYRLQSYMLGKGGMVKTAPSSCGLPGTETDEALLIWGVCAPAPSAARTGRQALDHKPTPCQKPRCRQTGAPLAASHCAARKQRSAAAAQPCCTHAQRIGPRTETTGSNEMNSTVSVLKMRRKPITTRF